MSLANLMNNHSGCSNKIKYVHSDLMKKIIKNCRGVKKSNKYKTNRKNFRILLGFKENDIFITKEASVLNKIMKVFSMEKILLQYDVLGYQIDAYFPEHKLAIEIDEKDHTDRDIDKERYRETRIKQKLQCKFIRINPDKKESVKKCKLVKNKELSYCSVCKKSTKNYKKYIETLKNKVLRQKSLCSLCFKDNSTFLKQKDNKKGKLVL